MFVYQLFITKELLERNDILLQIELFLKWLLWFIGIGLLTYCSYKKKAKRIYYLILINVTIVRMWVPCIDLTRRCSIKPQMNNTNLVFLLSFQIIGCQAMFNVVNDYLISIPQSIISMIMLQFLLLNYGTKDCVTLSWFDILKENSITCSVHFFTCIIIFCILQSMIQFYRNNTISALNQQLVLQDEISHLISNLNEGVISKSHDGISFCNDFGFKIMSNIFSITPPKSTSSLKMT